MWFFSKPTAMPTAETALPGRPQPILPNPRPHHVSGRPIAGPYPDGMEIVDVALGCFWGAEKAFWNTPGVWVTSVGYAGGFTENPTYEESCTGRTGHAETVRVVFDPAKVSFEQLLKVFWEHHDPTQGMRQGNDVGTHYRSAIYTHSPEQLALAEASRAMYQERLRAAGYGEITTEIQPAGPYYLAEDYHQQYLYKVPHGYRCHANTGLALPALEPTA